MQENFLCRRGFIYDSVTDNKDRMQNEMKPDYTCHLLCHAGANG